MHQSPDVVDRRRLGDTLARLSGDVQAIEGFVLGAAGEAISALVARADPFPPDRDLRPPCPRGGGSSRAAVTLRGWVSARRGYLHLDLKPSNIIADGGRAIIIDLSIARRPGRAPAGLGTWCYLAPEQARGGHVCDAADVWGVGAVLFEALTSKPPFDDSRVTSDLSLDAAEPELYPPLTGRAARLSGRVRARPSLSP